MTDLTGFSTKGLLGQDPKFAQQPGHFYCERRGGVPSCWRQETFEN